MSKNVATLLSQIDELREEDLIKLKNRIDYILRTKNIKTHEKFEEDMDMRQFYSVFMDIAKRRLNAPLKSYDNFKRMTVFKEFKASYKLLEEYMNGLNIEFSPVRKQKVYVISVNLIVDYVKKLNAPVTLNNLIYNIQNVPALIDGAFPEYAENGLLNLIF